MNTEFTDQLQEAMTKLPAPVPPDLVKKVCRRYRRRRATVWGAAAAGTAAVTGLAVILASPAAPASRTSAPVDPTTAYVVSHVTKALQSLSPSTILFAKTTHLDPGSSAGPVYDWSTRSRTRDLEFTKTGQLSADEALIYSATTVTHVLVDYGTKTWSQVTAVLPSESASPSASLPSCASGAPSGWSADPLEEAAILKAGGSSMIDGVRAIKLSELPGAIKLSECPCATSMTFWVNATTYLPVRIDQDWAGIPGASQLDTQMDMQWLPANRANEAKLTVHIPAGFPQVPWP
jgi:hypothetical protein